MKRNTFRFFLLVFLGQFSLVVAENIKVLHQVSGPGQTNSYLIYEVESKEAALIDPGGPVDSLISFINKNELKLKYIFVTHGHIDHVTGIPEIKKLFPKVKVCISKDEYGDMFTQKEWMMKNYGPDWFAQQIKLNPEVAKFFDFNFALIGKPDIYVEDNQTFRLGSVEIKTIHSPGHSVGGISYYTGNVLFSGDVLFYRTVGETFTQHGSREDQIKSVRRLYALFPESTIVYTGHGHFTDIGSEKKENKRITVDGGEWSVQ